MRIRVPGVVTIFPTFPFWLGVSSRKLLKTLEPLKGLEPRPDDYKSAERTPIKRPPSRPAPCFTDFREIGFDSTEHDPEFIDDFLPESIAPNVVLMNSTFS